MAVTSDAGLLTIYKIWYTDAEMENLLFRSSPVTKAVKKTRVGGRQYNFSALYGRGGAAAGDMTIAVTNAASGTSKNAEFGVSYGQMFSVFTLTQQEILASVNVRGAYQPAAVVKTFAATDAFRKLFATSLYGMGFGEVGQVGANAGLVTQGASNTIDFVDKSLVIKLDVGSVFIVTNGALPSSPLRSLINTVTKIDGTTVTFTSSAGSNETWAATDWVEIYGCRSGATPLLPVGLAGWLPTLASRSGANWTTYIGTPFYGVDRSVYPDKLAGSFILRDKANNEKYMDAVIRGIDAVRTAGGNPQILILNNKDYLQVAQEIQSSRTFFSQLGAGKGKSVANQGLSDMSFATSTNWVDTVWDDPFCPRYTAYIVDENILEFVCLSNVDTPINDGIAANDPGSQNVNGVSAPDMQYNFIIDDYITVKPGTDTANGPAVQVSINMYGSWVVRNPAHCCAIYFNP
jgi:hypothetical protein